MYINKPSGRLPKLQPFQFLHGDRTNLRAREPSIRRRSLRLGLGYLQKVHRRDSSSLKEIHHTLEIQTDLIYTVAIIGETEATTAGKELLQK